MMPAATSAAISASNSSLVGAEPAAAATLAAFLTTPALVAVAAAGAADALPSLSAISPSNTSTTLFPTGGVSPVRSTSRPAIFARRSSYLVLILSTIIIPP
jgi:hypothetical protein